MSLRTVCRTNIIATTLTGAADFDFGWSELLPGAGRAISALLMLDVSAMTGITLLRLRVGSLFTQHGLLHHDTDGFLFSTGSDARLLGIIPTGFGHSDTDFSDAAAATNHDTASAFGSGLRFTFTATGTWGSVDVAIHAAFLIA